MFRFKIIFILFFFWSCSSQYPRQEILGKKFISVEGNSLNDQNWQIPKDMLGEPVLLLIGYKQNSQFDIDRWLIGLDQTKTNVTLFEIPAIQGFFPKLLKEKIDSGMRKGIPKGLWKAVITVYQDGDKIQKFTGNINPNNARVVLLDKKGNIRYFYDEGFSVPALNQLRMQLDNQRKEK